MIRALWIPMVALHVLAAPVRAATTKNGFALEPTSVPVEEILAGGPARDGIPALDGPKRIAASESDLAGSEWVVGVAIGGEAAAYPLAILEWHELANDTVGGVPILVSYCPLCGTAMVFDRRIGGRTRSFGVSGLLYRSDLLLYDRESESLWSQIQAQAVTGAAIGARLSLLRSRQLPWKDWLAAHPETTVLSLDTGHRRPYGRSPYGDYAKSDELYFPVSRDRRYHPKTPTLGMRIPNGPAKAYPAIEVVRAGGSVDENFAGYRVRIAYDAERGVFEVSAPDAIEIVQGYWFAWMAFHPESSVFVAPSRPERSETRIPSSPRAGSAAP